MRGIRVGRIFRRVGESLYDEMIEWRWIDPEAGRSVLGGVDCEASLRAGRKRYIKVDDIKAPIHEIMLCRSSAENW